jgi:hypothetical protein
MNPASLPSWGDSLSSMALGVNTHWIACQVQPLKKKIHLGWEYNGLQDPTWESQEKLTLEFLAKHLIELFQGTSSWPIDEQVHFYHTGVERHPVRHPDRTVTFCFYKILYLGCWYASFGQFHFSHLGFEGDISIPAILVSAEPPRGEADSDPSTGASAGALRARAGKRKATANLTPQKNTSKAAGKPLGGIKINEPLSTTPCIDSSIVSSE